MEQPFKPDLEVEVTLWRTIESQGTIPVGLGLSESKRQLLFAFGKIASNERNPWWIVANRELHLMDFFFEHEIFFDGQIDKTSKHFDQGWNRFFYKIHFPTDSYVEFLQLLRTRLDGEKVGQISPKRKYALVEILNLIVNQIDKDHSVNEDEFSERWYHFLDILEDEVPEK